MGRFNAANRYSATLTVAMDSTQGFATVSTTAGRPAVPFKIAIGNEYMDVTHVSGSILEVIRGAEGSIPTAHATGAVVENRFTAGTFNPLWDHMVRTDNPHAVTAPQAGALRNDGGDTIRGGLAINPISAPTAPTVTVQGAPGGTRYDYRVTARTRVGETLASAVTSITNGNATLSGANFNRIAWTAVAGAVDYRVWRVFSGGTPSSLGVISTVTVLTLDDTGLAGGGQALPTVDTSGSLRLGLVATAGDVLTTNAEGQGSWQTLSNFTPTVRGLVPASGGGAVNFLRADGTWAASPVITNQGRIWVSHGDNVITFPAAHGSNNYRWVATLSQAPMGGITPRNVPHIRPLSVFVSNESPTRGKIRIDGGFGFISCGRTAVVNGVTERFDDVANTHTERLAATARRNLTGYSLNGFGFASCGRDAAEVGTTERFDDVANTHTARTPAAARNSLAGYSLNGFGFTSCGWAAGNSGVTERFDDVANTHTARTLATARGHLAGYSLNGFGFTSCGWTTVDVGTTERFDDVANTHTARTPATARSSLAGYSLNGFGFTSCGATEVIRDITERFDDVANTHTARTPATLRTNLAGYSLNGFGFTSCGWNLNDSGITERFDDVANTHTGRLAATARYNSTGYSLNEYFVNYITSN